MALAVKCSFEEANVTQAIVGCGIKEIYVHFLRLLARIRNGK